MAGVDALGFVFAPLSGRRLEPGIARQLVSEVPAFVTCVGLFQDQEPQEVDDVLEHVPLGILQFHGSEPASYCRQFGMPYIKAVSMSSPDALESAEREFADARGLLLDSHEPGQPGGTGAVFDWTRIRASQLPIVIAGGLTPHNVASVVIEHRPWAVDVSSGVESEPGVKDISLIEEFMHEVERGNRKDA